MKKQLLLLTLIFCLLPSLIHSQHKKPKLVVFLNIENLKLSDIAKFSSLMKYNGLKRVYENSAKFKNITIDYAYPTAVSGLASMSTGTSPSVHGAIADYIVKRGTYADQEFCMKDATLEEFKRYSRKKLRVPNIIDELYLNYPQSKSYSISYNPNHSLMFVGRKHGTALWFDEELGQWISSEGKYFSSGIEKYRKQLPWKPLYPVGVYTESEPFDADFQLDTKANIKKQLLSLEKRYRKKYSTFKTTPFFNDMLTDMAIKTLTENDLGKDRHIDFLHVNYSALEFVAEQFGVLSAKYQDAFFRLDKNLGRLLDSLDTNIGFQDCLLVVSNPKPSFYSKSDLKKIEAQSGVIELNGAVRLLNIILKKKYGKDYIVEATNGLELYLNKTLIKKYSLNYSSIKTDIHKFLFEVSGVENVYWKENLMRSEYGSDFARRLMKQCNKSNSGDIFIEPKALWITKSNNVKNLKQYYASTYKVPLLIMGAGIESKNYYSNYTIENICPTLCDLIGIGSPRYVDSGVIPVKRK